MAAAAALVAGCAASPVVRENPTRISYGDDPDNFGDLYLPDAGSGHPVLVMIHGGGWSEDYGLGYTGPLAETLVGSGIAVWNIEYRRVGGRGGWPQTLSDVDAATEAVNSVVQERARGRLDTDRVHVAGHSAGGHLAAWIAGRHTLGSGAPGAEPTVLIRSATTMAGVFDLGLAVTNGHDRYVRALLGGSPAEMPDRYRIASPIDEVPIGLPLHAFHGDQDMTVSIEQSRRYVAAAQSAGDPATLTVLPGVGHGEFGDPSSEAWAEVRRRLRHLCAN